MKVYESKTKTTVGEADPGLLLLVDGLTLIMKTEYSRDDGSCECYIVESGEAFCGKGDSAECYEVVVK